MGNPKLKPKPMVQPDDDPRIVAGRLDHLVRADNPRNAVWDNVAANIAANVTNEERQQQ
jgi:hypothetical protein